MSNYVFHGNRPVRPHKRIRTITCYCTQNDLEKISKKLGAPIHYEKYRMWHNVPHIGKTALAVDFTDWKGGYGILQEPKDYPKEITPEYVEEAINAGAVSLGSCTVKLSEKFGTPKFSNLRPYTETMGTYPPGYFTHRVGDGWKPYAEEE